MVEISDVCSISSDLFQSKAFSGCWCQQHKKYGEENEEVESQ